MTRSQDKVLAEQVITHPVIPHELYSVDGPTHELRRLGAQRTDGQESTHGS